MKLPEINPDFVAWAEHAGLDITKISRDGIAITPGWGGPDKYRVEYNVFVGDGTFMRRSITVDGAPPPVRATPSPRADALNVAADEVDDARDHDELHAAADVVRAGIHSRYIDRWVDELEKRWLS